MTSARTPTRVGAFFDMDKTLIAENSGALFMRHRYEKGDFGSWDLAMGLFAYLRYKVGVLDIRAWTLDAMRMFEGQSEAELVREADELFDRMVAPTIYPEAADRVRHHLGQGHVVAIVSGATRYVVGPLAERLGVEHILYTRLEVENGRFTGRVIDPICFEEGKIYWLQQLVDQQRIDLAKSYFYTDSVTDLPLLELVGHPVVVNPDPRLYRIAARRHWPVRFFAPPELASAIVAEATAAIADEGESPVHTPARAGAGAPPPGLDLLVDRKDWARCRWREAPAPDLAPGQVLLRVDRFALTANNVTYAVAGDLLGYWRFFPADEGWGRIPVMGWGDVVRSRHPDVPEGLRCFGFYPMSRYLTIEPGRVSEAQIVDGAGHREGLAPAYAQYLPTGADPFHAPEREDAIILLRGLFLTAFLAEDFLEEQGRFGAEDVWVSSASSKTAIALAHCLARSGRARAVGLTSARHLEFVRGLGCYDEVAAYESLADLPADRPAVYVDVAGDAAVSAAVHAHLGAALRHHMAIGATHWQAPPAAGELPGARPEFFFAPSQIQKRAADWGPDALQARIGAAFAGFADESGRWLRVRRGRGREAALAAWREVLGGRARPDEGHVLSLWDDA